jgi:DNA-directed RNA polymerase beta subunit
MVKFTPPYAHSFRTQNAKNHSTGEEECFCRPDPATTRNMKSHNYDKLGPSGFVDKDTYVEPGDVVIGKCMPQKQVSERLNPGTRAQTHHALNI